MIFEESSDTHHWSNDADTIENSYIKQFYFSVFLVLVTIKEFFQKH